jgi:hypothetical protein
MSDDMVEKSVDAAAEAAADVEQAAAEATAQAKKTAKKAAKAVTEGEVDASDVKAAVADVTDEAAETAGDMMAEGKKTVKQVTVEEDCQGDCRDRRNDLASIDAGERSSRPGETIDDAVDSGRPPAPTSVRRSRIYAIERQRIFVGCPQALEMRCRP